MYTMNWNKITLSLMVSIALKTAIATVTHANGLALEQK